MRKTKLDKITDDAYHKTHDALKTLYDALPPGQRRTVARNEAVREVLVRFGVIGDET